MINELIIPKNSPTEKIILMRYLTKYIMDEFSNISKPCYLVKVTRIIKDLFHLTGITPDMVRSVKKTIPKEILVRKIINDDTTIMCLIGTFYFIEHKDKELAKLFFYLLALKFYGSRTHIAFKTHCNPGYWDLALNKISSKHLFIAKGGVSNAIMYLADETFLKIIEKLKYTNNNNQKEWNMANDIVYSLRTRIAQSMRSLAEKYYELVHDPEIEIGVVDENEEDMDRTETSTMSSIPDTISVSICTKGHIDKKALYSAIENSGIRQELGIYIIKRLSEVVYREKMYFILVLMDRIIPLKELKLERKRNLLIKKISSNIKINKFYIKKEILNLLETLDISQKLLTISKPQLLVFFCQYISNYIANFNFSEME
jgi:hypothetical protein